MVSLILDKGTIFFLNIFDIICSFSPPLLLLLDSLIDTDTFPARKSRKHLQTVKNYWIVLKLRRKIQDFSNW